MPRNQAGNEVTVHAVQLSPLSREYQDVILKIHQTGWSETIASIERIQNPHLYQAYQLRKVKMDKDNGGINERQLFHGTNPESVTKINTQGFNRSFSGLNGKQIIPSIWRGNIHGYELVHGQISSVPRSFLVLGTDKVQGHISKFSITQLVD